MIASKVLVLIPARYASSRFPGKPLAKIHGISMIERVFRGVTEGFDSQESLPFKIDACVVTDHPEIENHVKSFGGQVCRIDDDVPSGTERIQLAFERFFSHENYELIINVQGDEPLLKANLLHELVKEHLEGPFDIMTLVKPKDNWEEFKDPNCVKAIYSPNEKRCLYFSRAAVPFDRDGTQLKKWFLHIGVYSFRPSALLKICQNPQSHYEKIECLEQLRAMELGLSIGAIETNIPLMGVDTPEDIKKLEGVLSEE